MRISKLSTFAALAALSLAGIPSRALAADPPKKPEAKMEILDDEPEAAPPPKAQPKPVSPPPAKIATLAPKKVTPPPAEPPAETPPPPAPEAKAEQKQADATPDKPSGAGGDVGAKPSAGMVVEDGPGGSETLPPVPVGEEKQAIAEYIRDQQGDIHRCYQKRLDDRPTLQGKLYVLLYIGPDGRVIGTTTQGLQDSEMVRCILPLVRKWEFARPASGGKLMVKYPFVFKPHAVR